MTSEARGKELKFWPQKLTRGREGGQYLDPPTTFPGSVSENKPRKVQISTFGYIQ